MQSAYVANGMARVYSGKGDMHHLSFECPPMDCPLRRQFYGRWCVITLGNLEDIVKKARGMVHKYVLLLSLHHRDLVSCLVPCDHS